MYKPGDEVIVISKTRWRDRRGKILGVEHRGQRGDVETELKVEIGRETVFLSDKEVIKLKERSK